jgi:hypothetical protein
MADENNVGIKVPPKDFLGYEPSAELSYFSSRLVKDYDEKNLPLAETIIKGASPQADDKARLDAADAIKKASGVDQPQWMNVIQSAINLNPRDLAISLNGGADVPSQARDRNGNQWTKVFNERKTTQNPYGELRHYVDANGKKYTPEEAEKAAGGAIVSLREIPLVQQNFYKAQGISADKVAGAQAEEWNKTQKIAATAMANAPVIIDSSNQLEDIYKKLVPYSVDPKTRELLAGIGDMRTGNQRSLEKAADKLKEIVKGGSTAKNLEDLKGLTGGFTFGFNLNERKQLINADNTIATSNDIDRAVNSEKKSSSSDNAVTARKADLLNRAQIIAAKGELPNLDLIQMAVNLEYQKALAINAIESQGGIGVAKPTLPNEVGDSFSLGYVKNKISADYGALAQMFGDRVQEFKQTSKGQVPAIGDIESMISNNPAVMRGKQQSVAKIKEFLEASKPILDQIPIQTQQSVVGQPELATIPVAPPKQVDVGQPKGSRPPVKQTSNAQPAAKNQESIADIRARLRKEK